MNQENPETTQYWRELHFQVVGSTTPFDFSLGLSPASVTVKQGETATFQVQISYSDPSYSGTTINIQVSGLGRE